MLLIRSTYVAVKKKTFADEDDTEAESMEIEHLNVDGCESETEVFDFTIDLGEKKMDKTYEEGNDMDQDDFDRDNNKSLDAVKTAATESNSLTSVFEHSGNKTSTERNPSLTFGEELETLPTIQHYHEVLSSLGKTYDESDHEMVKKNLESNGYSNILSAYYCPDCDFVFPDQKYLAGHKRGGMCVHECLYCFKPFSFRIFSGFLKHIQAHR